MTNKSVEQVTSAPRLPGRFYTFLVTSLAVILAILPFVAAQNLQWKTTAIIEHPTPNTSTATEATIVDGIRSVIEQAQASAPSLPIPNAHDLRINLNISSVELADPTKSRTTLTLENPDRQVSELISSLPIGSRRWRDSTAARGPASSARHTASRSSPTSPANAGFPRGFSSSATARTRSSSTSRTGR